MTVRNLETGREFKRLPHSLPAIDDALKWKSGSSRATLEGGEPTPVEKTDTTPATRGDSPDELPLAVRVALEFGRLLDYDVYTEDVDGEPVKVISLAYTTSEAIDALTKQLERFGEVKGYVRRKPDESDHRSTDGTQEHTGDD